MRVDFYLLSHGSAEEALPALAQAALKAGQRLVIVSADAEQRARIDAALWTAAPTSFLAHGMAGGADDARQPILIAEDLARGNGAGFVAYADGLWREPEGFERALLVFDEMTVAGARDVWRMLGAREGVERRFWKQVDGKWIEGP